MSIRVMHFGLGPIGAAVVRQVATRKGFKIVGAVDIDPAKVGRDLGEVVGLDRRLSVKVSARREKAIKAAKAGRRRALHELVAEEGVAADRRRAQAQGPDRLDDRGAGVSVTQKRARCAESTRCAKKAKVAVLGTGVNPGFAMDALPITLTGVCERVDSIRVDRVQDARIRRLPFQQKIGAGLTPRAVPEEGGRRQRAPRRPRRVDHDDRRRDGLEARQGHRRDPAEDRGRRRWRASSWPSSRATSAASSRTASATATASRSSRCTWRRISARPSPTTPSTIDGIAEPDDEDRRRRARRRRDRVDHRQLDPEGPRGAARAAHDAQTADPSWFGGKL